MKKTLHLMLLLGLMLALVTITAAAAENVSVFQDLGAFQAATGSVQIQFPANAGTALPAKPFGTSLLDYSCVDKLTGITLSGEGNTIEVTAPAANGWICFMGPGWNAGTSNTDPTPVTPTIIANAEDDYQILQFAKPVYAIGFELLTNSSASETITLQFADGSPDQVISDPSLGTLANRFEFVGFKSASPIQAVIINTTGGAIQNEGISGIWINDEFMTKSLADCTHGTYSQYEFVETKFVSAYGSGAVTPVVTSSTLLPGATYLIEASGVYYAGGVGQFDLRGDAKYAQDRAQRIAGTGWTDLVNGYSSYGSGLMELKVDGSFVEWGDFNPNHIYTITKQGDGSPLDFQFQINDIYAQNNTGGLCVSLFVNEPPVAEAGGPYTGDEGSSIALDGTNSSDPDGDVLSYLWSESSDVCEFVDATLAAPSLECTDNDSFTATLTVGDGLTTPASDTATVTVNNVAPTVSIESLSPELLQVGGTVSAVGSFTDPGTSDTHVMEWNWGDGSISSDGSHTYSVPGIYTVTLTVTDDDGGVGSDMFQFVVVYDPAGGFVTGGGWIDSPAGAYAANPDLVGKATFGFVSKYKKGATVPEGNTEFQFKAGDLNFHSTSYEWLVVTGSNYAKFKGVGTVNGEGSYKFMLSAGDGTPDTFQIRIWSEDESGIELVLYDNGVEQPIGGGSIVVHTK